AERRPEVVGVMADSAGVTVGFVEVVVGGSAVTGAGGGHGTGQQERPVDGRAALRGRGELLAQVVSGLFGQSGGGPGSPVGLERVDHGPAQRSEHGFVVRALRWSCPGSVDTGFQATAVMFS